MANPLKMTGRLISESKAGIAHVYINTEIEPGELGHCVIRIIRGNIEEKYSSHAEMVAKAEAVKYSFEAIKTPVTRAEQNTPPDKPSVVNYKELENSTNALIAKIANPQDLVFEVFPKPFTEMGIEEMQAAILKIGILQNQMRVIAQERGLVIRVASNKAAKEQSTQIENEDFQRKPSLKAATVKKAKSSGDKEFGKLMKFIVDMGLEAKYPGYHKMGKPQLKSIVAKEMMGA